jgi:hypothetical protein
MSPFMNLTQVKPTRKERLLRELRDLFSVVLYLAISLSIVATFKGLVLIQVGVNEFVRLYTLAIINSLALGKFVALTQNLPFMNAWDRRPLIWSVLYKSALMTLIVYTASVVEDAIYVAVTKHQDVPPLHPIILLIAHQLAALLIFIVLFTVRGIDQHLGKGELIKLIIGNEPERDTP